MTREEEITQAAENANAIMKENDPDVCTSFELGFEAGARWADQHPVSEEIFCKNDLNYIQGLEDGKKLSPWICVEDRLPNEEIPVIVLCSDGDIIKDMLLDKYCQLWQFANNTITHWMPIPELKGE